MPQKQSHQSVAHVSRIVAKSSDVHSSARAVPEEVPIALTYGGTTHAVMMASPEDLIDFALGFSLSENIISSKEELSNINIVDVENGIDIQMDLNDQRAKEFTAKRRTMAGPVGCGLCGVESIEDVICDIGVNNSTEVCLHQQEILNAISALSQGQKLRAETGAVHAASFYQSQGGIILTREDVGRHNALDKVIGALINKDIDPRAGALIITSRVSVDMVQKAASCQTPILIAVSTPTALAIRTADMAGITLVALARENSFEIYTHPNRIILANHNILADRKTSPDKIDLDKSSNNLKNLTGGTHHVA